MHGFMNVKFIITIIIIIIS